MDKESEVAEVNTPESEVNSHENLVAIDLREVTMVCDDAVHIESNGFTGWDTFDKALAGLVSFFTFGGVSL